MLLGVDHDCRCLNWTVTLIENNMQLSDDWPSALLDDNGIQGNFWFFIVPLAYAVKWHLSWFGHFAGLQS